MIGVLRVAAWLLVAGLAVALVLELRGLCAGARRRPGQGRALRFMAARMAYRFPWEPVAIAGALLLLAVVFARGGSRADAVAEVFAWSGVLITAICTAWWWLSFVARPHSVQSYIRLRRALEQRAGGVATRLDIAEHAGPRALRLQADVLRPSLARARAAQRTGLCARRGFGWTARWMDPVPMAELGVQVAGLGWGWWGERVFSTIEDATLRIGGPRRGKTLSLACHGLDAPGALITTSTRLDLAELVHSARLARGRVHVFNPANLGFLASTVRWRVLGGCRDFPTARRRANDLIPEKASAEGERWDEQARRILALLMHAAALAGGSMRDVMRWIGDLSPAHLQEVTDALLTPTPTPTAEQGGEEPATSSSSPAVSVGARARASEVRTFWGQNDRQRSSVVLVMSGPLSWMGDDRARDLGDAPADHPSLLDVRGLIERGETLHLIGHEDQGALSPLIAALVAEIAHQARQLAGTRPGGRLDPPLTALLDEAALVCPVPLEKWTADMGGRGVTLHISVQSLAQLRQRWGKEGAEAILANTTTFLVFGGSPSAADLEALSRLTGEHRMKVIGEDHEHDSTRDGEQRGEYRWSPVLSPAQIRALGPEQVVVMRRDLPVAVGWAPMVTARKGWTKVSLIEAVPPGVRVPTVRELDDLLSDTGTPGGSSPEAESSAGGRAAGLLRRVQARADRLALRLVNRIDRDTSHTDHTAHAARNGTGGSARDGITGEATSRTAGASE